MRPSSASRTATPSATVVAGGGAAVAGLHPPFFHGGDPVPARTPRLLINCSILAARCWPSPGGCETIRICLALDMCSLSQQYLTILTIRLFQGRGLVDSRANRRRQMSRPTPVSARVLQRRGFPDGPRDLTAITNHFPRRRRMISEIRRQALASDPARELTGCRTRTPAGKRAAGCANHARYRQARRRTSPSLTLVTT